MTGQDLKSTDYSSDNDDFFLTQRAQDTRSGVRNADSTFDTSFERIETEPVGPNDQRLLEWATRLELESITLKDLVRTELIELVQENHRSTQDSLQQLNKRLDRLIRGPAGASTDKFLFEMRQSQEKIMSDLQMVSRQMFQLSQLCYELEKKMGRDDGEKLLGQFAKGWNP